MISLMCGAPSFSVGVGSLILLVSYMIDRPIGPPALYTIEWLPVVRSAATGSAVGMPAFTVVLPSAELLGMLVAGIWCGGLGIVIAGSRRPYRRATTSIVGVVICTTAFVLAWFLFARASFF